MPGHLDTDTSKAKGHVPDVHFALSHCADHFAGLAVKMIDHPMHIASGVLHYRLVQVRSPVLAELFELETFRTSLCTNTGQENCSRGHIAHLHGSAQYLQHGGLLWDTPPRDLHSIYQCF